MAVTRHPNEVSELLDHVLEALSVTRRHVELASGRRGRVIAAGEGDPLVLDRTAADEPWESTREASSAVSAGRGR